MTKLIAQSSRSKPTRGQARRQKAIDAAVAAVAARRLGLAAALDDLTPERRANRAYAIARDHVLSESDVGRDITEIARLAAELFARMDRFTDAYHGDEGEAILRKAGLLQPPPGWAGLEDQYGIDDSYINSACHIIFGHRLVMEYLAGGLDSLGFVPHASGGTVSPDH